MLAKIWQKSRSNKQVKCAFSWKINKHHLKVIIINDCCSRKKNLWTFGACVDLDQLIKICTGHITVKKAFNNLPKKVYTTESYSMVARQTLSTHDKYKKVGNHTAGFIFSSSRKKHIKLTVTFLPDLIFCDSSLFLASVATASTWYLKYDRF